MQSISKTLKEVYVRRLRTRKVMVRLLQQSQHAPSTVCESKAMCTNDAHLQLALLL